jgi:general stress protein CsbA
MMIKNLIQDVKWRYLVLSLILAFCILLLSGSLLANFKSEAFVFSVNKGLIEWGELNQVKKSAPDFFESSYWAPLHILLIVFAQFCSCLYLLKKAKRVELTNGIAHGLFSAMFLYQFEVVSSLIGIVVSFLLAYRKKTRKANRIKSKITITT